jgi:hypothetical protein
MRKEIGNRQQILFREGIDSCKYAKARPQLKLSETKSKAYVWFARVGEIVAKPAPIARLRPERWRTFKPAAP